MRRMVEPLTEKKEIIKCTMDCMQAEIDRITDEHNEHLKRLFESHNLQISETKKKQWVSKMRFTVGNFIAHKFLAAIIFVDNI